MSDPFNLRNEYSSSRLEESDLPGDPMELFERWFLEAFDADLPEPSAMTLATSNSEGRVSSRIILLKGFDGRGFHFYTNYKSRKGRDLEENHFASVNFFWPELERQVHIEGRAVKMSAKDSDLYHSARPRNNQLGAWASEQSEVIKDRYTLEAQFEAVSQAYQSHSVIPRPKHWGGYVLIPGTIEFWQGRESRLHDRLEYYRDTDTVDWKTRRLSP